MWGRVGGFEPGFGLGLGLDSDSGVEAGRIQVERWAAGSLDRLESLVGRGQNS